MKYLLDLFRNRAFAACLLSWFCAQALKVVFYRIIEKQWSFRRFWGLGGMPSSHSAVMCTLAVSAGIMRGFGSLEFCICLVLALVVMTDAAGVRRESGQHAKLLNKIIQELVEEGRGLTPQTLKELVGHSPFEVLVGALLGVLVAFIVM